MQQSRSRVFALATLFAFALLAPVSVSAQEEVGVTTQEDVAVLAPVAAPAVGSTSGDDGQTLYAAAERALLSGDIGSLQEEHLLALVAAAPSWDEISGYGAVEASRAMIAYPVSSSSAAQTRLLAAQRALQGGDLGSVQENSLRAVVSAGQSWDETSGYRSVEASRAANAIPVAAAANSTQVPGDVRWAPAGTIEPESSSAASRAGSPDYLAVALGTGTRLESVHLATIALPDDSVSAYGERTRVLAAQQALLSPDLGGLQEEALTAVVEAKNAAAEASMPEAPAPTAAKRLARFRAIELDLSRSLGAD